MVFSKMVSYPLIYTSSDLKYVYNRSDVEAGTVTPELMNSHLYDGYLPWYLDKKGRLHLDFDSMP